MNVMKIGIALAAMLPVMVDSALSADLDRPLRRAGPPPVYVEEPYAPALRWAGLYGGLSAGAAFNEDSGFVGAATLGYNWATPYNIVYGVEADVGFLDLSDRFSRFGPLWGTFRGRVGYAMGSLLPYATYGLALVESDDNFRSSSDIQTGWVAGLGVEMAMFDRTSVKLEYLHMDFGDSDRNFASRAFDDKIDLIRVGMNMKF